MEQQSRLWKRNYHREKYGCQNYTRLPLVRKVLQVHKCRGGEVNIAQTSTTRQFQKGEDHHSNKTTLLFLHKVLQTLSGFLSTTFCLVFTTRPPHAAAETSVCDFTEKLIADESVCSDYKSATLLMRWEDVYWRTEERAIEEEQHAMQLVQLRQIHLINCESKNQTKACKRFSLFHSCTVLPPAPGIMSVLELVFWVIFFVK